jgi:diguanylate cyclase (GGDEF)-like protein/PAS domain S-box-containing protein
MNQTSSLDDWVRLQPDPVTMARGVTLSDLRLERWNTAFARLLGLRDGAAPDDARAALAGAGMFDLERAPLFAEANAKALRDGHHRTRWQFHDPAGRLLEAEVELTALPSVGADALCVQIRDVSAVLGAQTQLAASEARFRDLFETVQDALGFIAIDDEQPRFLDCNAALVRLYGARHKHEVIGTTPLDFSAALQPNGQPSQDVAQAASIEALRQGHTRFDWLLRRRDGHTAWIEVALTRQPSWGEHVLHFSGRDITDRKRAELALAQGEELGRVTLQSIADAVITCDPKGRVTMLNPAAERLTGCSPADAVGRKLDAVLKVVDQTTRASQHRPLRRAIAHGEPIALPDSAVLLHRDGAEYQIEGSAAPIILPDGKPAGAVIVFRDVTQARGLAAEVSHQARHDPLTGLPNRREFERRIAELLEQARDDQAEHALCYVDLDQFKVVNDSCGHAAGDQLLAELARLLRTRIRRHDLLARLGGDEFGVLLVDCPSAKAETIAQDLLSTVADFRFGFGERTFAIGASIGIVPITAAAASTAELLSQADLACFTAKDLGRNRIHLFRHGDAELSRRRRELQWATELREALEEQRFVLYAQPIRALGTKDASPWHEVLLRLRQRDGRLVLPGAFLPAAERFGLMPLIDRYVLRRVLDHLLDPAHAHGGRLSVNVSGRSMEDAELIGLLETYLANPAHEPGRLCLELTETTAVSHLGRTREFIGRLRGAGCRFALDDFGTGVSSFAYLKHLPVDYLKLDGSFVRDITREPIDHAMVESIHRLAQIMGFETIAEFVEDEPTLALLRDIGVQYGQGFLLGKPAPIESLPGHCQPQDLVAAPALH